jgi:peptide/nickel transport system substrate-binding protein
MYPAQGDVTTAKKMLDDAGWKAGEDGVRQKGGVRLAFTLGTTSGNQARELAEQIIKQQLDQIGVKITIKNAPDYLDVNLTGFDYQTVMFAWAGSPDPYQNNVIFQSTSIPKQCSKKVARAGNCDASGQNYTKMRDPAVDSLLSATNRTTDPSARAALFNQADRRMASDDVTVVPLFQKPTQLAYKSTIGGVVDNPTIDGFTWNIEDWTYTP